MSTMIDLSHRLEPGMPSYPGLPEPRFSTFFSHAECLRREMYAPGTAFEIATYELGGNTGTYVDAPYHRHADRADLSQLPLDVLANLPAVVVRADGPISAAAFEGVEVRGRAVLVNTNWSALWYTPDYFRSGPFLTADACRYLVDQAATLVGIDCANIDDMADRTRPAHTLLLGAGIPLVEHLTRLDELPTTGFRFFAVPPAIAGGTSFPVRAFALLD